MKCCASVSLRTTPTIILEGIGNLLLFITTPQTRTKSIFLPPLCCCHPELVIATSMCLLQCNTIKETCDSWSQRAAVCVCLLQGVTMDGDMQQLIKHGKCADMFYCCACVSYQAQLCHEQAAGNCDSSFQESSPDPSPRQGATVSHALPHTGWTAAKTVTPRAQEVGKVPSEACSNSV